MTERETTQADTVRLAIESDIFDGSLMPGTSLEEGFSFKASSPDLILCSHSFIANPASKYAFFLWLNITSAEAFS